MNIFRQYSDYLKDNPQGLWFKRKLYGWGWVPVRWQGWAVIFIAVGFFVLGVYVGESDDAPGAVVIGFVIMTAIIFYFGYKKGEKPKWQWGLPSEKEK
jgi:hypothetical protein